MSSENVGQSINLSRPSHLIASGFGVGLLQRNAREYAVLLGACSWYFLNFLPVDLYFLALLFGYSLAILASIVTARHLDAKNINRLVIGEVIGVWLALALLPADFMSVASGIILFYFLISLENNKNRYAFKLASLGVFGIVRSLFSGLIVFVCLLLPRQFS